MQEALSSRVYPSLMRAYGPAEANYTHKLQLRTDVLDADHGGPFLPSLRSALGGGDRRLFLHDFQHLGDDAVMNHLVLVDVEMPDLGVIGEIDVADRPLECMRRDHLLPKPVRLVVVDHLGRAADHRRDLADAVEGDDEANRYTVINQPARQDQCRVGAERMADDDDRRHVLVALVV